MESIDSSNMTKETLLSQVLEELNSKNKQLEPSQLKN